MEAFRDGVDSAVLARKESISDAVAEYKSVRDGILASAKSDCDGSDDPKEAQTSLKNDLNVARDDFKESREGITKVSDAVQDLIETRKNAVEAAKEEFRSAVDAAQDKLKDAMMVGATDEVDGE